MSETQHSWMRTLLGQALVVVLGLLGLMWALEAVDTVTLHALDQYGVHPRDLSTVGNIALAPWLHFGWLHLAANSVPFAVLGVITYLSGVVKWLVSTLFSILGSGLLVWFISPPNSVTAGASGLVFGWLVYLIIRGYFSRRPTQIAIGVVVLLMYGGILLGMFPGSAGVSWQGHLGGALGGAVAAWYLHGREQRRTTVT